MEGTVRQFFFSDFSLVFDESYGIKVSASSNDKVIATITANTFFGIRHGLESLSQLIVYDDIRNHLLVRNAISKLPTRIIATFKPGCGDRSTSSYYIH